VPIKIRPARPNDMEDIRRIVQRIWAIGSDWVLEERYGSVGDERWDRWLVPKVMARLWEELDHLLVSEVDGQIAGFIAYGTSAARRVGTIHYNGVAPEFRGRGVGTRQVEHVLGLFREAGMEIATVGTGLNEGHAAARRVYEKCGFERVMDYTMYAQKL